MKITRRGLLLGAAGAASSLILPPQSGNKPGVGESILSEGTDHPVAPQTKLGYPFMVWGAQVIQPNTSSGVNTPSLMNPSGGPMEIIAIKLHVEQVSPNVGVIVHGGAVGARFRLGKIPLTGSFVPIWCFGKSRNLTLNPQAADGSPSNWAIQPTTGAYQTGEGDYLWLLSKPLYVPPGMTVEPTFENKGQLGVPLLVTVQYFCRSVESGAEPSRVILPYVAAFETPGMQATDALETFASTENDLVNLLTVPVRVKRFMGRVSTFAYPAGTGGQTANSASIDTAYEWLAAEQLSLTAYDSAGFDLVKDPSSWRSVFCGPTRSWECDWELPPKGYVIFQVTNAASNVVRVNGQTIQFTGQIAMVGERSLDL